MSSSSRPLSPHMQVYRPQITSVLSISHRLTGIFLALGFVALAWWLVRLAAGPEAFGRANALLASLPGTIFLVAVVLSFFFHLCNGIRHLFWDAGVGITKAAAAPSGWAVIVSALILTIATFVIAFGGGQ